MRSYKNTDAQSTLLHEILETNFLLNYVVNSEH